MSSLRFKGVWRLLDGDFPYSRPIPEFEFDIIFQFGYVE